MALATEPVIYYYVLVCNCIDQLLLNQQECFQAMLQPIYMYLRIT